MKRWEDKTNTVRTFKGTEKHKKDETDTFRVENVYNRRLVYYEHIQVRRTLGGNVEHVENTLQYGESLPNYQGTGKSLGDTEANKIGN